MNGMEKGLMALSAVLVMTAFTVTGVYLHADNEKQREDESYVIDFSAIEAKNTEIQNAQAQQDMNSSKAVVQENIPDKKSITNYVKNDVELDYDPNYEVSHTDELLKKQDVKEPLAKAALGKNSDDLDDAGMIREELEPGKIDAAEETLATSVQPMLNFSDADMLKWPVVGDVLINYSMDKTVYFPTLDQYKYNPGIVISAATGTNITAPATGRVTKVSYDPQYGNIVVMDLGNGYELTCGQLEQLTVSEGSFVNAGDLIGCISTPTKYFSLEGSNLFLELQKDGVPVSPLPKLQ